VAQLAKPLRCVESEVPVPTGVLGRKLFFALPRTLVAVADISVFKNDFLEGDKTAQARRRRADRIGEADGTAHACQPLPAMTTELA
jgi:hypothetical protein